MASVHESQAIAPLPSGPVEYTLRRTPRARGIRVTINDHHGIVVSIPPTTRRGWANPTARVDRFLVNRESWLRRHLARHDRQREDLRARGGLADGATFRYRGELHTLRVAVGDARRSTVSRVGSDEGDELVVHLRSGRADTVGVVLAGWLKARARSAIEREVERHALALEVRPARVSIRDPRSRWGSASRDGRLMFSWRLVLAPPEALGTVVVHELAHLREFGHGRSFWELVASRRPDHAEWRRWLRRHSYELHHALDELDGRA